ncbi:toxin-antitoxin system YwqK family antitoxin [Rufibacter soli]
MRRVLKAGLLLVMVFLSFQSMAVVWPWKWNQVGKKGDRHGKWREYYSHKPEQLMYVGRFSHGKERGTWKTYSQDGKLERMERYKPAKKKVLTTFYHPNGKVSHQGTAYLFEENGYLKYQWHGDWQYYDSTGTWRGWKSFNKGKALSKDPIVTKKEKTQ